MFKSSSLLRFDPPSYVLLTFYRDISIITVVVDAAQQSTKRARQSIDIDPPLSVGSSRLTDSRALSYLKLIPMMLTLVQVRNKSDSYTRIIS